jgi:nucleotide-binding universal stress UspA family protein
MERILVLIDPSGLERETMEFACHIANLTESKLTGLFYNPQKRHEAFHMSEIKTAFKSYCDNHQTLHKPDAIEVSRLEDVYLQSRFADLLILTPDYGAKPDESVLASENILNVLKHSECAVFVAPLTAKQPSEIVFTYDGSPSSVFAIKQFTQLFPELKDLTVTLLEVNSNDSVDVDSRQNIDEYLRTHYRYVNQLVLKGQPEDELFSFLLDKKQMYIVMGAFGKHFMHSVLHRSTATLLLKTTALPVFISHK